MPSEALQCGGRCAIGPQRQSLCGCPRVEKILRTKLLTSFMRISSPSDIDAAVEPKVRT